MKPVIALAVLVALGAVGGTIWIGSLVREDTVVAQPYEEGLEYDRERRGREALGWSVEVAPPAAGPGTLAFALRDGAGRPLEGAEVALTVGRPDTGRGQWTAAARPREGGGYAADLAFPAPGPWEIRFDVRRGPDRVRLTRTVDVPAAAPACDLAAGPCTVELGGAAVTLELSPRPPRPLAELRVVADVRAGGAPVEGAELTVRFGMKGMEMFPADARLAPAGPGRYQGKAVLVRCPSGRTDWTATLSLARPGAPGATAELGFKAAE